MLSNLIKKNDTLFVIEVFNETDKLLSNISAYGRIYINTDNEFCLYLERIGNTNENYRHFGFGSLMMELLFELLSFYEKVNNIEFTKITGTIGEGGGDDSLISIPFYRSFSSKKYGEDKLIVFTGSNRHLEYQIKRIE